MKNTRIDGSVKSPMEQFMYGINPILEVLKQGGDAIIEVAVASGRKGSALESILALAAEKNIPVSYRDRSYLDKVAGCQTNQGIVALCKAFAYKEIGEIVDNRQEARSVILVLDGVSDPQNLGALIRTAHCLGVSGVIIPGDRAAAVTATVIKASAGAVYLLPIVREINLSRTIDYMKKRGFWIYGAEAEGGMDIEKFDDEGPVGLVLGGEGRGLRPSIRGKCDFLLSIPLSGVVGSLNVSVAAGIILYEILRKRGRRN